MQQDVSKLAEGHVDLQAIGNLKKMFAASELPKVVRADKLDYSKENLKKILSNREFDEMASEAYDSDLGYSIRYNEETGKREMFVAGTRDIAQWGLNAFDAGVAAGDHMFNELGKHVLGNALWEQLDKSSIGKRAKHAFDPGNVDLPRRQKTKILEKIARENHVDVIYGHSRGGALVADMKVPGAKKIGLDAAMILTNNKEMMNIEEGGAPIGGGRKVKGLFDQTLGVTGRNNIYIDADERGFHNVWRKYDSQKPGYSKRDWRDGWCIPESLRFRGSG